MAARGHPHLHGLPPGGARAILMGMAASMEIRCTACRRVALARAEPVYENFRKVSETFVCTACGHCYPSREATPFVDTSGRPQVFSEADKPSAVKVFQASERRRSCAWCRHFIVNPFRQRCGLNNREVEATDLCARFSAKPDEPAADAPKSPSSDAGSRFEDVVRIIDLCQFNGLKNVGLHTQAAASR